MLAYQFTQDFISKGLQYTPPERVLASRNLWKDNVDVSTNLTRPINAIFLVKYQKVIILISLGRSTKYTLNLAKQGIRSSYESEVSVVVGEQTSNSQYWKREDQEENICIEKEGRTIAKRDSHSFEDASDLTLQIVFSCIFSGAVSRTLDTNEHIGAGLCEKRENHWTDGRNRRTGMGRKREPSTRTVIGGIQDKAG
ncbi:hypothetical protein QE152_g8977 [Popillia japonica]|uniref:Uncharacterized protein n=1 Tax=Popillia japonica TaxID=7064 RepID=A0AAW1LZT1_POPJA